MYLCTRKYIKKIKNNMQNNRPLIAHLCLFFACAFWGLMAPLGKDAMTHGITGIDMVTFRVTGGAILFWLTSLFTPKEHVPRKDLLMLIGCHIRPCDQPVLLHDRPEHNIAHQREHRHDVDAYLRDDSGSNNT